MKFYTKAMLEEYMKNDWILNLLEELETTEDEKFRTHLWMKEMDSKRMVYADIHGDLLTENGIKGLKILDVGGGYTSLFKRLIENQQYTLLDFMAHGTNSDYLNKVFSQNDAAMIVDDWYHVMSDPSCNQAFNPPYDIIIANDIVPDVDQRMSLFIDHCLKVCRELRITVTFYNSPRFYTTKRIDDSEMMTFLSYDGEISSMILKKYQKYLDATTDELDRMKDFQESIFWNGRQICYIRLKGTLA